MFPYEAEKYLCKRTTYILLYSKEKEAAMINDLLENEYVKIVMEDNIMDCRFKVKFVNLKIAKACVEARISVSEEKQHLVLVDMRDVNKVPKVARQYMATERAQKFIKAGAILVKSPMSKIIGNFFFFLCKPSCPSQVFNNRTKAIQWLKKMK